MAIALSSLTSINVGDTNWGTAVNGYWSTIRTGTSLGQIDVYAPVTVSGAITLTSTAFGKLHQTTSTGPYTITLPSAAAPDVGSLIGFISGTEAVIARGGSDTIDGLTSLALLPSEFMVLLCSAAGTWRRIEHRFLDRWQSFTPTFTATTTNPTKGATRTETCSWRRDGADMLITFFYNQTSAGTAGAGTYKIAIPGGYSIDSSKCALGAMASATNMPTVVGHGHCFLVGTGSGWAQAFTLDSTNLGICAFWPSTLQYQPITSSYYSLSNTSLNITFQARVPISGWG